MHRNLDFHFRLSFSYIQIIIIVTWSVYSITSSWWGHTIGSPENRSIKGDPMVWSHQQDVIQYARSRYYYNNMFIIYLFPTLFWFYKLFWSLIQKKAGTFAVRFRFLTLRHHVFRLWFHAWNLLYAMSQQNQLTDVSLVLKDSDTDSGNLSSLIRLSVSDGQKTDSSNVYHL